jgi:hypothetical protein
MQPIVYRDCTDAVAFLLSLVNGAASILMTKNLGQKDNQIICYLIFCP